MKLAKVGVILFFLSGMIFAQEALKSTEEEYFEFLSLEGIFLRPSLIFRSLSDSVWQENYDTNYNIIEENQQSDEKNPLKKNLPNENPGLKIENPENLKTQELETENFEKRKNLKAKKSKSEKNVGLLHPWQNLELGKRRTIFLPKNKSENWFTRGINQKIILKIYGPEIFNSYNTKVPYGQNDGALWQGRGYNASFTAGARLEAYGFEATFKPQITFSQNKNFEYIKPKNFGNEIFAQKAQDFGYFWGNIDLPQRFGESHFWNFDLGETEIRYSWHSLTFGFGTQTAWIGPAYLNPMIWSCNAPSYPKFDIGLRRTKIVIPRVNWHFGDIEARIWLGQLSESNFYDSNPSNNKRQITGLSLAFSPSFIPGFSIGLNKVCLNSWEHFSLKYLNPFYSSNDQVIQEDQKMSIFVDWIFPKIGFEIYGEIGKDDYSANVLTNPFHTAIYTVGFKQMLPFFKNHGFKIALLGEWNNFEMSQDFQLEWNYMGYYAHHAISQGYTQRGQILGAGTGFFGNSLFFAVKTYFPRGSFMLYVHHHSPDNNYIYNEAVYNSATNIRNFWAQFKTFTTLGGTFDFFATPALRLFLQIEGSCIAKRFYEVETDLLFNFRFCLGAKYNF